MDGSTRAALAVTRSLGRAGVEVTVVASRQRSLAGASRYAQARWKVPDPARDPEAARRVLCRLALAAPGAVWLPVTDLTLEWLLSIADALPEPRLPFAPAHTLKLAWDKGLLLDRARALGIACPRTRVAVDRDVVADCARQWGWPLVLKPARSKWWDGACYQSGDVRIASDLTGASRLVDAWPTQGPDLLVQEHLPGHGMGVFLLADRGRVVAHFAHRRLREKPPAGGVSVLRESIRPEPQVLESAVRLVEGLDWHGVCMVEFRVDPARRIPYLMEINPRFWGSLQLAVDAGADFPRWLLAVALGQPIAPPEPYRMGVRSRWLLGDLDHLLIRLRRPAGNPEVGPTPPPRWRALASFLNPCAGRLEVWRLSDVRPAFQELADWSRALRTGVAA